MTASAPTRSDASAEPRPHPRPRAWWAAAPLVVLALVVAVQAPGWSHASLRASSPTDGEAVDAAPDLVSFTFNEPVDTTDGALRVFDGSGARVDDGVQAQPSPEVAEVGLGDLTDGGYVATFHVTSADGHVIRGATTFRVGSGAALDDDTVATLFAEGGDGPIAVVATVVRGIDLGAALVAVGALLAALASAVTPRQRRIALQTAEIAAWTGVVATVLTVPLQAMATTGQGVAALGSSAVLSDAMSSSVGVAALTRLGGLMLVVGSVVLLERPSRSRPVPTAVGVVGGIVLTLGSLALDGHTRTVAPTWLMVSADLVHVTAAAVWAGGLVVVARALGRRRPPGSRTVVVQESAPTTTAAAGSTTTDGASAAGASMPATTDPPTVAVDPTRGAATTVTVTSTPTADHRPDAGPTGPDLPDGPDASDRPEAPGGADGVDDPDGPDGPDDDAVAGARLVAAFSAMAGWSMLVLAVAGTAMAWALVRQPRALVTTDQGWTLVAKVGVVGVILVVAAYNRWRLVPAVTAAGPDQAVARDRLRGTVRLEVLLLVVVLGLTAVLVNLRPASEEVGIGGPFDTVVAVTDDIDLNLVVDPNRAGPNEVHVYLLDRTGRPLDADADVSLELTQVDQDIGPIERTPLPAGPGHWVLTGSELVVPGTWEVTTIVGLERFSEERTTVELVVNPS